ncbi:hypothetical protein [Methylobacterium sp. WL19]|uniref:hypothetical protein n=1 Tax=Methylobacterium sp. WL19 TaxID=2603896 RepID=UPI0011C709FF|nr:hypothetical protein [Methylobacterium sp. WL19]TXN27403.1 hypothetical protein FV220_11615 [Methylobacterium sp. WL19]
MPKYIHYYLPLSPMKTPEEYSNGVAISNINCKTPDGDDLVVRLQGFETRIDVIIVSGLYEHRDRTDVYVNHLTEHMLTILKLDYRSDADVIWQNDGFLSIAARSDDEWLPFNFIKSTEYDKPKSINSENIASIFSESLDPKQSDALSLLAESLIPNMPNHYKFLSLYRALELLRKNKKQQATLLDAYQKKFSEINTGKIKQIKVAFPAIRNICAHGRLDMNPSITPERGDIKYPIIGIGYNHKTNIYDLLHLFREIIADTIRSDFALNITANPRTVWRPIVPEVSF